MYNVYVKNGPFVRTQPRGRDMRALISLYEAGHLSEAESKAKTLVTEFPNEPVIRNILNASLAAQGKLEEAEQGYRDLLEIAPDYAEPHNNLGALLTQRGRLDEALDVCRRAVGIKPEYVEAHGNLGNIFQRLCRPIEAIESCRRALHINPNYGPAHNFLGNALRSLGRLNEAEESYRTALRLMPGEPNVYNNLGSVLFDLGRIDDAITCLNVALNSNPNHRQALEQFGDALLARGKVEEAAVYFERAGTRESLAKVLECHYARNDSAAFDVKLRTLCETDTTNIRAAAISAFAAQQRQGVNAYPFCTAPLDYISATNVASDLGLSSEFAKSLYEEVKAASSVWEPAGKTTTRGFQSTGDLFSLCTSRLMKLEQVIRETLSGYQSRHVGDSCEFISKWPRRFKLNAWHVRLLKGGYQDAHIYPGGWLSGVFYLKVPDNMPGEEGAIEFSLHGYDYVIRDHSIPTKRHAPKSAIWCCFRHHCSIERSRLRRTTSAIALHLT